MAIPISLLVCAGIALATIGYAIKFSIDLFRTQNKILDNPFAETMERLRQLADLSPKLQQCEGKEREAVCRQIAQLIRADCRMLLYLVHHSSLDKLRDDGEISRLGMAAYTQVRDVYLTIHWILLLLRFRPSLLSDCHRVRKTMRHHAHAWLAYFRFLRAQYPAEFGQMELPE